MVDLLQIAAWAFAAGIWCALNIKSNSIKGKMGAALVTSSCAGFCFMNIVAVYQEYISILD